MKKTIIGALTALLIFCGIAFASYAAGNIKIFVNGKEVYTDVPPIMVSGRVMVPLRAVAEALNATVKWNAATNAVMITTNAVSQPIPTPITKNFSGNGVSYIDKFALNNGPAYVSYQFSGDGNFIFWLLDGNGKEKELIANEIGSCSGKTVISIEQGMYFVRVNSNGPWSITIEQK
ncbi:MAG: copper amine oxidase N-terminal domain-containing protein [Eubacteriales bacterium]|jgi:hypothetical protein